MSKIEFLNALRKELKELSENDINQYTQYYSEMIDDMIEDGLSEDNAVAAIGSIDEITAQITEEVSRSVTKEPIAKRKLKAWEIVLLAAGSPVWFSLLVAAFAVVISLLAAGGSVIISFYAASLAFGASAFGSIPYSIFMFTKGNTAGGIFLLGAGLICAGLAIFAFAGTNKLAKLYIKLCKKTFTWLTSCLKRKENAK